MRAIILSYPLSDNIAEFLVEKGIDFVYVKERFKRKGTEYVFKDAEVVVGKTYLQTMLDLVKPGISFNMKIVMEYVITNELKKER